MNCKDCRFWSIVDRSGICRRYAPKPTMMACTAQAGDGEATWPRTYPSEWCGEFESTKQQPPTSANSHLQQPNR